MTEELRPLLLTVDEAAELTRLSASTIRRLIEQGRLPVVRPVDDSVRIAPSDLRTFLETRRRREGPVMREDIEPHPERGPSP